MDPRRRVVSPESALASDIFDKFCSANTLKAILSQYRHLCSVLRIKPTHFPDFYPRLKAKLSSWRAQGLWSKFEKRASHKCYARGKACFGTRVLIIGGGPCGLRAAIEAQLLGAKVVLVEKRDRFSRNNVLHLWPFVITDLKALGAKKFYGKFCAGSIDHISIRQLQCILLKVALLLGVEIHEGVGFEGLREATESEGWRASTSPADHPVSHYNFDVLIGADGRRNTLEGFKRKALRAKLAIAITANFINKHTEAEARVKEISGVSYIFNQKFFQDLNEATGIDLENIVYYKDETHYFVMTAKKQSLLSKGVLLQDHADTARLLSHENISSEALMYYALEAARFSTENQLPNLEFAVNHYGQPDVAMFDFTAMYAAENACRVLQRKGHKLLMTLVGDSLLEPFWPTGSGCARGFLSSFDACWMLRSWTSGLKSMQEVIAERESIYRLLGQTTPENLNKEHVGYTIDPHSRYPNLNLRVVMPFQVKSLYDTDEVITEAVDGILDEDLEVEKVSKKRRRDSVIAVDSLLNWLRDQVLCYGLEVSDVRDAFVRGDVLSAIIHRFRPDLIEYPLPSEENVDPLDTAAFRNQVAFDLLHDEYGLTHVMSGFDSVQCPTSDFLSMVAYLSQIYEIFRGEIPQIKYPRVESADDLEEQEQRSSHSHPKYSVRPAVIVKHGSSKSMSRRSRLSSGREIRDAGDSESSRRHKKRRSDERSRGSSGREIKTTLGASLGASHSENEKQVPGMARDLEAKLRGSKHIDKKPKDLVRAIGKIEKSDWNVQLIEKKIAENKGHIQVKKDREEKVPRWSREAFDDKREAMKRKMEGGNLDKNSEKLLLFEESVKKLGNKLKEGNALEVGQRGYNKVSQMAEQLVHKLDRPKEAESVIVRTAAPRPIFEFPKKGGSECCHFCTERVYVVERMTAEGKFFHRNCFRCEYCNTSLRVGNYVFDREGRYGERFYCTPHHHYVRLNGWKKLDQEEMSNNEESNFAGDKRLVVTTTRQILSEMDERGTTPERVEFENSVDFASEEELLSEMDEDDWTERNFGASNADNNTSDEASDLTDDDDLTPEGNKHEQTNVFQPGLSRPDGDGYGDVGVVDVREKKDAESSDSDTEVASGEGSEEEEEEEESCEGEEEEDEEDEEEDECGGSTTEIETDSEFAEDPPHSVPGKIPTIVVDEPEQLMTRIIESVPLSHTHVTPPVKREGRPSVQGSATRDPHHHPHRQHVHPRPPQSQPQKFEDLNDRVVEPVKMGFPERTLPRVNTVPKEWIPLRETPPEIALASKMSLELKTKYLHGVNPLNALGHKKAADPSAQNQFRSVLDMISEQQKLLQPAAKHSATMQAILDGAEKLKHKTNISTLNLASNANKSVEMLTSERGSSDEIAKCPPPPNVLRAIRGSSSSATNEPSIIDLAITGHQSNEIAKTFESKMWSCNNEVDLEIKRKEEGGVVGGEKKDNLLQQSQAILVNTLTMNRLNLEKSIEASAPTNDFNCKVQDKESGEEERGGGELEKGDSEKDVNINKSDLCCVPVLNVDIKRGFAPIPSTPRNPPRISEEKLNLSEDTTPSSVSQSLTESQSTIIDTNIIMADTNFEDIRCSPVFPINSPLGVISLEDLNDNQALTLDKEEEGSETETESEAGNGDGSDILLDGEEDEEGEETNFNRGSGKPPPRVEIEDVFGNTHAVDEDDDLMENARPPSPDKGDGLGVPALISIEPKLQLENCEEREFEEEEASRSFGLSSSEDSLNSGVFLETELSDWVRYGEDVERVGGDNGALPKRKKLKKKQLHERKKRIELEWSSSTEHSKGHPLKGNLALELDAFDFMDVDGLSSPEDNIENVTRKQGYCKLADDEEDEEEIGEGSVLGFHLLSAKLVGSIEGEEDKEGSGSRSSTPTLGSVSAPLSTPGAQTGVVEGVKAMSCVPGLDDNTIAPPISDKGDKVFGRDEKTGGLVTVETVNPCLLHRGVGGEDSDYTVLDRVVPFSNARDSLDYRKMKGITSPIKSNDLYSTYALPSTSAFPFLPTSSTQLIKSKDKLFLNFTVESGEEGEEGRAIPPHSPTTANDHATYTVKDDVCKEVGELHEELPSSSAVLENWEGDVGKASASPNTARRIQEINTERVKQSDLIRCMVMGRIRPGPGEKGRKTSRGSLSPLGGGGRAAGGGSNAVSSSSSTSGASEQLLSGKSLAADDNELEFQRSSQNSIISHSHGDGEEEREDRTTDGSSPLNSSSNASVLDGMTSGEDSLAEPGPSSQQSLSSVVSTDNNCMGQEEMLTGASTTPSSQPTNPSTPSGGVNSNSNSNSNSNYEPVFISSPRFRSRPKFDNPLKVYQSVTNPPTPVQSILYSPSSPSGQPLTPNSDSSSNSFRKGASPSFYRSMPDLTSLNSQWEGGCNGFNKNRASVKEGFVDVEWEEERDGVEGDKEVPVRTEEREKARQAARQRARLKSDKELGLSSPTKYFSTKDKLLQRKLSVPEDDLFVLRNSENASSKLTSPIQSSCGSRDERGRIHASANRPTSDVFDTVVSSIRYNVDFPMKRNPFLVSPDQEDKNEEQSSSRETRRENSGNNNSSTASEKGAMGDGGNFVSDDFVNLRLRLTPKNKTPDRKSSPGKTGSVGWDSEGSSCSFPNYFSPNGHNSHNCSPHNVSTTSFVPPSSSSKTTTIRNDQNWLLERTTNETHNQHYRPRSNTISDLHFSPSPSLASGSVSAITAATASERKGKKSKDRDRRRSLIQTVSDFFRSSTDKSNGGGHDTMDKSVTSTGTTSSSSAGISPSKDRFSNIFKLTTPKLLQSKEKKNSKSREILSQPSCSSSLPQSSHPDNNSPPSVFPFPGNKSSRAGFISYLSQPEMVIQKLPSSPTPFKSSRPNLNRSSEGGEEEVFGTPTSAATCSQPSQDSSTATLSITTSANKNCKSNRSETKRRREIEEIQLQLETIETEQRLLESQGVAIEKKLRGEEMEADNREECEIMEEWFNLVRKKTRLARLEKELLIRAEELELAERQEKLEEQLDKSLLINELNKSTEDKSREIRILHELKSVERQRDVLISRFTEDLRKYESEDADLEAKIESSTLSPKESNV